MPVLGVELAGDDRGTSSVAVLEDFEEVSPLGVGDRGDGKVIDDEKVETREARQDARKGAVGSGESQLIEESRRAAVGSTVAFATCLMG